MSKAQDKRATWFECDRCGDWFNDHEDLQQCTLPWGIEYLCRDCVDDIEKNIDEAFFSGTNS